MMKFVESILNLYLQQYSYKGVILLINFLNKARFVLTFFVAIFFITGCSTIEIPARAYPVEGPLVSLGIAKPIEAIFSWDGSGHGKISFTLNDGEICTGEYNTIAWSSSTSFFGEIEYRKYWGRSVSLSGMQYGQAITYGDKGTIIQAEYFVSSFSLKHGYGLAKDNKENVYKIMF